MKKEIGYNLPIGKIPPQSIEIEKAVLGAVLLERGIFERIEDMVTEEVFYSEDHRTIFRAITRITKNRAVPDLLTLVQELKSMGELERIGGAFVLTKLTDNVTSTANIDTYCAIILQKYIQRELIRKSSEILYEAYNDDIDVFDLLDQSEQKILSIGNIRTKDQMSHISNVVVDAIKKIEHYRTLDSSVTGIPSGFPTLDRATKGWHPGLIILAARPSVGKSALAIILAKAANEQKGVPVAVFSLEMTSIQNVIRMLSSESEIWLNRLQTGKVDDDQMKQVYTAADRLAKMDIIFDEDSSLTLRSFRAKARRLKKKKGVGLIIVDYLQLMTGGDETRGKNREQEISTISRGLKLLSKELDIPIIALSQMSRDIEKRTGSKREPMLSDLRESGAIEQDADMVIFLYGPEDEQILDDASLLNRRYAKIAKNRDGILLKVELEFHSEIQKIIEYKKHSAPGSMDGYIPVQTSIDL